MEKLEIDLTFVKDCVDTGIGDVDSQIGVAGKNTDEVVQREETYVLDNNSKSDKQGNDVTKSYTFVADDPVTLKEETFILDSKEGNHGRIAEKSSVIAKNDGVIKSGVSQADDKTRSKGKQSEHVLHLLPERTFVTGTAVAILDNIDLTEVAETAGPFQGDGMNRDGTFTKDFSGPGSTVVKEATFTKMSGSRYNTLTGCIPSSDSTAKESTSFGTDVMREGTFIKPSYGQENAFAGGATGPSTGVMKEGTFTKRSGGLDETLLTGAVDSNSTINERTFTKELVEQPNEESLLEHSNAKLMEDHPNVELLVEHPNEELFWEHPNEVLLVKHPDDDLLEEHPSEELLEEYPNGDLYVDYPREEFAEEHSNEELSVEYLSGVQGQIAEMSLNETSFTSFNSSQSTIPMIASSGNFTGTIGKRKSASAKRKKSSLSAGATKNMVSNATDVIPENAERSFIGDSGSPNPTLTSFGNFEIEKNVPRSKHVSEKSDDCLDSVLNALEQVSHGYAPKSSTTIASSDSYAVNESKELYHKSYKNCGNENEANLEESEEFSLRNGSVLKTETSVMEAGTRNLTGGATIAPDPSRDPASYLNDTGEVRPRRASNQDSHEQPSATVVSIDDERAKAAQKISRSTEKGVPKLARRSRVSIVHVCDVPLAVPLDDHVTAHDVNGMGTHAQSPAEVTAISREEMTSGPGFVNEQEVTCNEYGCVFVSKMVNPRRIPTFREKSKDSFTPSKSARKVESGDKEITHLDQRISSFLNSRSLIESISAPIHDSDSKMEASIQNGAVESDESAKSTLQNEIGAESDNRIESTTSEITIERETTGEAATFGAKPPASAATNQSCLPVWDTESGPLERPSEDPENRQVHENAVMEQSINHAQQANADATNYDLEKQQTTRGDVDLEDKGCDLEGDDMVKASVGVGSDQVTSAGEVKVKDGNRSHIQDISENQLESECELCSGNDIGVKFESTDRFIENPPADHSTGEMIADISVDDSAPIENVGGGNDRGDNKLDAESAISDVSQSAVTQGVDSSVGNMGISHSDTVDTRSTGSSEKDFTGGSADVVPIGTPHNGLADDTIGKGSRFVERVIGRVEDTERSCREVTCASDVEAKATTGVSAVVDVRADGETARPGGVRSESETPDTKDGSQDGHLCGKWVKADSSVDGKATVVGVVDTDKIERNPQSPDMHLPRVGNSDSGSNNSRCNNDEFVDKSVGIVTKDDPMMNVTHMDFIRDSSRVETGHSTSEAGTRAGGISLSDEHKFEKEGESDYDVSISNSDRPTDIKIVGMDTAALKIDKGFVEVDYVRDSDSLRDGNVEVDYIKDSDSLDMNEMNRAPEFTVTNDIPVDKCGNVLDGTPSGDNVMMTQRGSIISARVTPSSSFEGPGTIPHGPKGPVALEERRNSVTMDVGSPVSEDNNVTSPTPYDGFVGKGTRKKSSVSLTDVPLTKSNIDLPTTERSRSMANLKSDGRDVISDQITLAKHMVANSIEASLGNLDRVEGNAGTESSNIDAGVDGSVKSSQGNEDAVEGVAYSKADSVHNRFKSKHVPKKILTRLESALVFDAELVDDPKMSENKPDWELILVATKEPSMDDPIDYRCDAEPGDECRRMTSTESRGKGDGGVDDYQNSDFGRVMTTEENSLSIVGNENAVENNTKTVEGLEEIDKKSSGSNIIENDTKLVSANNEDREINAVNYTSELEPTVKVDSDHAASDEGLGADDIGGRDSDDNDHVTRPPVKQKIREGLERRRTLTHLSVGNVDVSESVMGAGSCGMAMAAVGRYRRLSSGTPYNPPKLRKGNSCPDIVVTSPSDLQDERNYEEFLSVLNALKAQQEQGQQRQLNSKSLYTLSEERSFDLSSDNGHSSEKAEVDTAEKTESDTEIAEDGAKITEVEKSLELHTEIAESQKAHDLDRITSATNVPSAADDSEVVEGKLQTGRETEETEASVHDVDNAASKEGNGVADEREVSSQIENMMTETVPKASITLGSQDMDSSQKKYMENKGKVEQYGLPQATGAASEFEGAKVEDAPGDVLSPADDLHIGRHDETVKQISGLEREESTEIMLARSGNDSISIDGNIVNESTENDVMLATNADDNISIDSNIIVKVTDEFEDGPLDLLSVSETEVRFGESLHTRPPGIVVQSATPNQSTKSLSITPIQGAGSDDVIQETSSQVKQGETMNSYFAKETSKENETSYEFSGEYPNPVVAVERLNSESALSNESRGSPCPTLEAEKIFVDVVGREPPAPLTEADKANSQSVRDLTFQSQPSVESLGASKPPVRRCSLNFVEFMNAEAIGVDISQYMNEVHDACENIQGGNDVDLNEGACVLEDNGTDSTHEQQENLACTETVEKVDGKLITTSYDVDESFVENQNTDFRVTSSFDGLTADDDRKTVVLSETISEHRIGGPAEKPEVADAILKSSAENDQDDSNYDNDATFVFNQSEGEVLDIHTAAPVAEVTSRETYKNEKLRESNENYKTGGITLRSDDISSDNKKAKISTVHGQTSSVTMEMGQTISDENEITETIKETVNQLFGQIESRSTANLEIGDKSVRVDETTHDATAEQEIANADERGVTTDDTDAIKEFKADYFEDAAEREEETPKVILERRNEIKILDLQKKIEDVTAENINSEGQIEAREANDLDTGSDVMIASGMDADIGKASSENETTLSHSHSLHVLESPSLLEDSAHNKLPQGLDVMKEINLEERHMHEDGARVSRPQTAVVKMASDEEGKDSGAPAEKRTVQEAVTTQAVVNSQPAMSEDALQDTGDVGLDTDFDQGVEGALGEKSTAPEQVDGKVEIGTDTVDPVMSHARVDTNAMSHAVGQDGKLEFRPTDAIVELDLRKVVPVTENMIETSGSTGVDRPNTLGSKVNEVCTNLPGDTEGMTVEGKPVADFVVGGDENEGETALANSQSINEKCDDLTEVGMPSGDAVADVTTEVQVSREEAEEKGIGSYTEPSRSVTGREIITSAAVRDNVTAEKPFRRVPSITIERDDGIQVLEPEPPETVEEVPEDEPKLGHRYQYYKGEVYDGYFQLDMNQGQAESTSSSDAGAVATETAVGAKTDLSPVDGAAVDGSVGVAVDTDVRDYKSQPGTLTGAAIMEIPAPSQNSGGADSQPDDGVLDGNDSIDINFASEVSEGLQHVSGNIPEGNEKFAPVLPQQSIELTKTPPNSPLRPSRENTEVMEPGDEVNRANDDVNTKGQDQGKTTSEDFGISGATLGERNIDDTRFERGRTPEPLTAISKSAFESIGNVSDGILLKEAQNNTTADESIKDISKKFDNVKKDAVDVVVKQLLADLERELEMEQADEAKRAEVSSSGDGELEAADLTFPSHVDSCNQEIDDHDRAVSTPTDQKEMTLTNDVSSFSKSADEPMADQAVLTEDNAHMLDKLDEFGGEIHLDGMTEGGEDSSELSTFLEDVLKLEEDGGQRSQGDDLIDQQDSEVEVTMVTKQDENVMPDDMSISGSLMKIDEGSENEAVQSDIVSESKMANIENKMADDKNNMAVGEIKMADQELKLRQTEESAAEITEEETKRLPDEIVVYDEQNVPLDIEREVIGAADGNYVTDEKSEKRVDEVFYVDDGVNELVDQAAIEAEVAGTASERNVDTNGGLKEAESGLDQTEVEVEGAGIVKEEIVDNNGELDQTEVKDEEATTLTVEIVDNDGDLDQTEVKSEEAREFIEEIVDNVGDVDQTEVKDEGAGTLTVEIVDNDGDLDLTELKNGGAGVVSNGIVDDEANLEAPALETDIVREGGLVGVDDDIAYTNGVVVAEGGTDEEEYANEHNNDNSAIPGHFENGAEGREVTDKNIAMYVDDLEDGAESVTGIVVDDRLDEAAVEEIGRGKLDHGLMMPGALIEASGLGGEDNVAGISDTEAEIPLQNGDIGANDLASEIATGEKGDVSAGLEIGELQSGELPDLGGSAIPSYDVGEVVEEKFVDEQKWNRTRRVTFEENAVIINSSGELERMKDVNLEYNMATTDKADDNDVIGMVENGDGLVREYEDSLEARLSNESGEKEVDSDTKKDVDILVVKDDVTGSEDDVTGSGVYENDFDFEELVSEDEDKDAESDDRTTLARKPVLDFNSSDYFINDEALRTPCKGEYFESEKSDAPTTDHNIANEDTEQTEVVIDASDARQETGGEHDEDERSLHKNANESQRTLCAVPHDHQPDPNVPENIPAEVDLSENDASSTCIVADNDNGMSEEPSVSREKTEVDSVPEEGSHIEPEEMKSSPGDGPADPEMISPAADDYKKDDVNFEVDRTQSGDGHSSPGSPGDEQKVHKGYHTNDDFDIRGEKFDDVTKKETFKTAATDQEMEADRTSNEKFGEQNLSGYLEPISVDKNIIEPEIDRVNETECAEEGEVKFEPRFEVRSDVDTAVDGSAHVRADGVTEGRVDGKDERVDEPESAISHDRVDENAMLHLLRKDDEFEFRPTDGGEELDLRNVAQGTDEKVTDNMIETSGESAQDVPEVDMQDDSVKIKNETGSEQEPDILHDENAMLDVIGKDDEFEFRPTEGGAELDLRDVVSGYNDKVTENVIETSGEVENDGNFDHIIAPTKLNVFIGNKENMAAAEVNKTRPKGAKGPMKSLEASTTLRSPRNERHMLAKTPERSPTRKKPVIERKPLTKIQPLPPGKLRPSRLRQNIRVLPRPVKGQSEQYRKSEFQSRDPCIVGPKKAEENKGEGKGRVVDRSRSPVKSPWGPRYTEERSKARRANLEDVQFELKVKPMKVPICAVSPYTARSSRPRLNSNKLAMPGRGKSPGSSRSPARHDDVGDDVRADHDIIGELRHDATDLEDDAHSNCRSLSPGRAWIEKELEAVHAKSAYRGSTARFHAPKRPEAPTPSAKGHLSKSAEPVNRLDKALRASGAKTAPLLRRSGPNSYRRRLYRPATYNITVPEQDELDPRSRQLEDMSPPSSEGNSGTRAKYLPHPPSQQLKTGRGKSKDNNKQTTSKSGGESPRKEEDKKQKEYFRNELKRLQTSLQRESSKIKAPPVKPHFPYVFTNLAPYYNTYTASYLIESAEEVPISRGYMMRKTAIGLCDPWEDLRMDREMLPRIERRLPRPLDKKKQAQKNREKGEGSTRLPKFPAVELDTRDLSTRKLNYDDVRMLRNKLREKYSANAGVKVDEDYKRTKQDYHRMELDRLDQVHPSNRSHMKSAYFAYLRNTPGSKRAINECVKKTEEELEEEEKERQRKENEQQQQQQTVEATS